MADEPIKPSTFTSASAAQAMPFMHDTRDINVQLLREVQRLEQLTTQRMDGIEKAVAVAHDDLVRMPTAVQQAVVALRELIDAKLATHVEKFSGIEKQFEQLDKRLEKSAQDSDKALASALQAAKELGNEQNRSSSLAIAKSEEGTTKQIDQQGALTLSIKSELDSRIADIKDRLTTFQATEMGKGAQKTETRNDTSLWVAIGSLAVGIVLGAMGYLIAK